MSEVKRCYYTGSLMVLASDYDRLEQECERLRHTAANDLLDRLVTELLDSGAKNYQESVFDLDLGSELLTASVILRYRDKPSAHELRMLAEAERDELRIQVEAMREHAKSVIDAALQAKP